MADLTEIQRVIDGDTFATKNQTVRVGYIDTPESVHPDESRNVPAGEVASKFAKDVLPRGTEVSVTEYDKGVFGRSVSGVSRNIGGRDIDYGLVALDQEMSNYYTKYGEHPDPMKHDQYKAYFSQYAPYQYGDTAEPLSAERSAEITALHERFTSVREAMHNGEATREEFDIAIADLYENPADVVAYRNERFRGAGSAKLEEHDASLRFAHDIMMQDPKMRDQYNKNVRNTGTELHQAPEQEPDFWLKTKTAFSLLNTVSNASDMRDLFAAREHDKDIKAEENDLLNAVPAAYHEMVLTEAETHNTTSALVLREQLLEDIKNNTLFDNMAWYEQLGYGAVATIVDPTTLVAGGVVFKGVKAAGLTQKAWATGRVGGATAALTEFAGAGLAEGMVINAPRLGGDHTYTPRDYALDIAMDAGFGVALGGTVKYAGKPAWDAVKGKVGKEAADIQATAIKEAQAKQKAHTAYSIEVRESQLATQDELIELARQEQSIAAGRGEILNDVEYEAVQEATAPLQPSKANKVLSSLKEQAYTPTAAIDDISAPQFQTAMNTIARNYEKGSPMNMLLNSQKGLNKKDLSPEERIVADKLNADILRIAAMYPDGKMPVAVSNAIKGVTFRHKTFKTRQPLAEMLEGRDKSDVLGSNDIGHITSYVTSLKHRSDELFPGMDVQPQTRDEFFDNHQAVLTRDVEIDDEVFQLAQGIPKEVSMLRDVIELNNIARKKEIADTVDAEDFNIMVEELNGMVSARLNEKARLGTTIGDGQGELPRFKESHTSFGKSVKMSPDEIVKQLNKEGLPRKSPERKARMEELKRTGRAAVTDDVNAVGTLRQRDTGKIESQRALEIDSVEDTGRKEIRVEGYAEADIEQDLLPRGVSDSRTVTGYKDVSVENLNTIRDNIRNNVLKKTGVLKVHGKREARVQQRRLAAIHKNIVKDKPAVLARMVSSGNVTNVMDVLRVVKTLEEIEAGKVEPGTPLKVSGPPSVAKAPHKVTEESLDHIDGSPPPLGSTPEKVEEVKQAVKEATDKHAEELAARMSDHMTNFVASGEREMFRQASKPVGVGASVGRLLSVWTKDMATKLGETKFTAAEFVAHNLLENGRGFAGKIKRKATAAIIRDSLFKQAAMKFMPSYRTNVGAYAAARGKAAFGKMQAQQRAGADNSIVAAFNKDVFLLQELRRQGKPTERVDANVLKFVDDWDKAMSWMHNQFTEANIGDFKADRKVKNYIPHVWKEGKLKGAISKHGIDKVEELLTVAYRSSSNNKINPIDPTQAKEAAQSLIQWIQREKPDDFDPHAPVTDSRAKARKDLDTSIEIDGLSVLDLLDTEVVNLGIKYSNRMAGWVGMSKASGGAIRSDADLAALRANLIAEGEELGKDTAKADQWLDDSFKALLGRPTRGGLTEELRQFKDLTALTKMGGLGTAQLIETGQVITRSMVKLGSDPAAVKKVFDMAGESLENKKLMQEIQSVSNVTNDLEYIERQSEHSDQHEVDKINAVRTLSKWVADKATFGSYKAEASRLLGKTSGYNAIRRMQSRIVQASFMIDVANHFKFETGRMGNARMADIGLTDIDGGNEAMKQAFNTFAEFDSQGGLTSLNIDKWPTEVREELSFAMLRDEAQQIMRPLVGEQPPWMNKPMLALLAQFRTHPIVAMNKSLARNAAFADEEAVVGTMLNSMFAGMVRYAKFVGLGAAAAAVTGGDIGEGAEAGKRDAADLAEDAGKYVSQFGLYGDLYSLTTDKGGIGENIINQVPVLGLAEDYATATGAIGNKQMDAALNLLPLGNTAYGDAIHAWAVDTFK